MLILKRMLSASLLLATSVLPAQLSSLLEDGNFDLANYAIETPYYEVIRHKTTNDLIRYTQLSGPKTYGGSIQSTTVMRENKFGNPDAFVELRFRVPGGGLTSEGTLRHANWAYAVNQTFTISPSLGSITALAFDLDQHNITSNTSSAFLIYQNGTYYASGYSFNSTNWGSVSFSTISATDFMEVQIGPEYQTIPGSHPDFSSNGAPMQFGFRQARGGGGLSAGSIVGVDNFEVAVTQVPEPASSGLIAAMLTLVVMLRYRSRR